MRHSQILFTVVLSLIFFISSCSSTHQAYLRSLHIAFSEPLSEKLDDEQIKQSPADLIYVTKDGLGTTAMALAYIENGRYKWVSADGVTLIVKDGRIIKTLSLSNNLDFVSSSLADPLNKADGITNDSIWKRSIDFNSSHFGIELESSFKVIGSQQLNLQNQDLDTVLIEEHVKLLNNKNQQVNGTDWVNQFWLHRESGKVLQSKQKLVPEGPYFDIIYVSRALRL